MKNLRFDITKSRKTLADIKPGRRQWNLSAFGIYLESLWRRALGSFWFLPALVLLGAVVLSIITLTIDEGIGSDWVSKTRWIYSHNPADARALLSTIAGSMITVAGVVFSITIVVLTLASSQLGPRLIRNFMLDKSNQVVLGVFTGTYLYCLLILRRIQSVEDASFVPSISVSCGILLAVLSIGVLIYFIHHVTVFMQVESVVNSVSHELTKTIKRLFPPAQDGDGVQLPVSLAEPVSELHATGSGYMQAVDEQGLIELARRYEGVLELYYRPGQYLVAGAAVARFGPCREPDQALVDGLNACLLVGVRPTPDQDAEFAIRQLVEIAVRALSPGINDPFTAITCLDRLTSGLALLACRGKPRPNRRDENGTVRLVVHPVYFEDAMEAAYNPLRQAGCRNQAVAIHMLEGMAMIAPLLPRREDRDVLLRHAHLIAEQSLPHAEQEKDRQDIRKRLEAVQSAVGDVRT